MSLAVLALSACSGGGSTPSTPANNPSTITATTTVAGTATSGITVVLSTALDSDRNPTGTIVGSIVSGSDGTTGEVVFNSGIPTTGKLCLWSSYTVGTQTQTLASCHSQPHPATATINFTI